MKFGKLMLESNMLVEMLLVRVRFLGVADCAAAFRGHACVAPRKLGLGHRFFRCTEDELK